MRLPVPNLSSPITNALGKIIPPWNSWFQQFSQNAPDGISVTGTSFKANSLGNLFIQTGTPVIILVRGTLILTLTGQKIIPIAIGDIVNLNGAYTAKFLGD